MVTIVCQRCDSVIEHYEHEKVDTLYGICSGCGCKSSKEE
ncbi:GapA-binding peptide SR1P [Aneurinibacillus terranovensis]|nr:GapA-binding peptide SR1P [Aneurinibacillus terranovensis]